MLASIHPLVPPSPTLSPSCISRFRPRVTLLRVLLVSIRPSGSTPLLPSSYNPRASWFASLDDLAFVSYPSDPSWYRFASKSNPSGDRTCSPVTANLPYLSGAEIQSSACDDLFFCWNASCVFGFCAVSLRGCFAL